ncbi:SDR family NAD(P)-dependent oxidoreductase [Persicimonas caeni]|uniref:SDR family NAD(P)-dependent oxidoreductase n=1 Tax=Persicimonas caeni TaxID=2292766 RepID=A0A4Y6PSK9_PERCE|nr:SDR family oxidoreductase [Persicimonas caeni]QDG51099.1 SDR family NAD(P)-dependent oxidoreductase [Persicimonas caeni]QED32320.1 SDR family NAD(P)-dependent oxidoreductase [Persicimonas caeni]
MPDLDGQVAFITGSTRGIGREIAIALAKRGCNIVVTGKTDEPRDDVPGTIYTTAEEVEEAGAEALPLKLDVRYDDQIEDAINQTVDKWGRLDILINNAGAIHLKSVLETPPKRFDLLMGVNARAAYACSYYALPHMIEQNYGHILMASPPIAIDRAPGKAAYALSKLGMTFVAQSLAEEVREHNIGVNAFWPVSAIETQATIHFNLGTEEMWRKPDILSDMVLAIVSRDPSECTGNAFYDEDVLREEGVEDFSKYNVVEGSEPPPLSALMFDPEYQS